jgi:5'-3' exonuclease
MGIKNLTKFLKTKYPNIFRQVELSSFGYKKIAIDISIYICRFKVSNGDNWLDSLLKMTMCLRKNNIHFIVVYDGGFPVEKNAEHAKRKMARQRNLERIATLQSEMTEYLRTGTSTKNLENIMDNHINAISCQYRRILVKKENEDQKIEIDPSVIFSKIEKMKRYIISITPADYEITKKLFDILSIPWIVAPMEAETLCYDLCARKAVDAVLSEDSDLFAYGNPTTMLNINFFDETCIVLNHKDILNSVEMTQTSFLDFCIMCGTDYNMNIPKIGSERSFLLMKQYKSIEVFADETDTDVSILKHNDVRLIFKNFKSDLRHIPYCSTPNYDLLHQFIVSNNILINIENIKSCFSRNIIFNE